MTFEPSQFGLSKVDNFKGIIESDPVTRRLLKERDKWKNKLQKKKKKIDEMEAEIAEFRKERMAAQKAYTIARRKCKDAIERRDHHRRVKAQHQKKVNNIRNSITSRRAILMHNAKAVALRDAYKAIGLPVPKRLENIKRLAVFKNKDWKDDQDRREHSTEEKE